MLPWFIIFKILREIILITSLIFVEYTTAKAIPLKKYITMTCATTTVAEKA